MKLGRVTDDGMGARVRFRFVYVSLGSDKPFRRSHHGSGVTFPSRDFFRRPSFHPHRRVVSRASAVCPHQLSCMGHKNKKLEQLVKHLVLDRAEAAPNVWRWHWAWQVGSFCADWWGGHRSCSQTLCAQHASASAEGDDKLRAISSRVVTSVVAPRWRQGLARAVAITDMDALESSPSILEFDFGPGTLVPSAFEVCRQHELVAIEQLILAELQGAASWR